jgi:hypothetical protein
MAPAKVMSLKEQRLWVNADDIEEQVFGLIKRIDRIKQKRTTEEEAIYKWLVHPETRGRLLLCWVD